MVVRSNSCLFVSFLYHCHIEHRLFSFMCCCVSITQTQGRQTESHRFNVSMKSMIFQLLCWSCGLTGQNKVFTYICLDSENYWRVYLQCFHCFICRVHDHCVALETRSFVIALSFPGYWRTFRHTKLLSFRKIFKIILIRSSVGSLFTHPPSKGKDVWSYSLWRAIRP